MEEIEFILDSAKEGMNSALAHLVKELRTIRAGKATPAMLGNVKVNYYDALHRQCCSHYSSIRN